MQTLKRHLGDILIHFSMDHPKLIGRSMIIMTLALALLAALPSLWPAAARILNPLKVDADPENMLPRNDPERTFHNDMKTEMSIYDIIVVGIVNTTHKNGVFNTQSLHKIHTLTQFAKTLQWPDKDTQGKVSGVVSADILAPSTVDNISQGSIGEVKFEWLMHDPPTSDEQALEVRRKAQRIPLLQGTLTSTDGKALCLYLPLTSKEISYRVYNALRDKIAILEGEEEFHIAGLPVAEDVFGVEMFIQMAISAPAAMLVIFLLMLAFFKNLRLIMAPMIIALISVISTMALLIISGNTVHIMSSMIPIFIMPIAVVDSIHILSECFDCCHRTGDHRTSVSRVMKKLFTPMLYTSLTTAAGFASLALVPIPPVQIFGLFVAIGVMLAWLLSVSFIPAYIVMIPKSSTHNFVSKSNLTGESQRWISINHLLKLASQVTLKKSHTILILTGVALAIGVYGISKVEINDNPVRWFTDNHPIRVADRELNRHFGGTYMAYLALEASDPEGNSQDALPGLLNRMDSTVSMIAKELPATTAYFQLLAAEARQTAQLVDTAEQLLAQLDGFVDKHLETSELEALDGWSEASLFIARERQRTELFKQPQTLEYIDNLQKHLLTTGIVGKTTSVADFVKTVHRELRGGDDTEFRIPDSASGVAQTLLTYQNSHRPQDLWRFVTPDFHKAVIWVQLKSGDNRDMSTVVEAIDQYFHDNPPPIALNHQWFGLTYINVIWQHKMVRGMLAALIGSFLVVLCMMALLMRSLLWGLLAMVPLTVTVFLIYGVVGLIGKDYDMPIAVLSALALGMAIDFSIHFLVRARTRYHEAGSWDHTMQYVFGEPARAIVRNMLVVSIGFLPLLAASLVPYNTVGILIGTILLASGLATLLIQPALGKVLEKSLFPHPCKPTVNSPTDSTTILD